MKLVVKLTLNFDVYFIIFNIKITSKIYYSAKIRYGGESSGFRCVVMIIIKLIIKKKNLTTKSDFFLSMILYILENDKYVI